MRLLFSDFGEIEPEVFKRLILLADEIAFMDHPSVSFGNWGIVGGQSQMRKVALQNQTVRLSVHTPPNLQPGDGTYLPYLGVDLQSLRFREVMQNALASSDIFAKEVGRAFGNDNWRAALTADKSLLIPRTNEGIAPAPRLDSAEERRQAFNGILMRASIKLTSTLIVAEKSGCIPVSSDPHFSRLLALRTCDSAYVGSAGSAAALVGLEVMKAVLPDELLEKLTIDDIIGYRQTATQAYAAWSVEIQRLAAQIEETNSVELNAELHRIIASQVAPQLIEYTKEMKSIRDRLFGNLVKQVVKWQVPTLSIAYVAGLSLTAAIGLALGNLTSLVPPVVDYYVDKRDKNRRNAFAFLIGLATEAKQKE